MAPTFRSRQLFFRCVTSFAVPAVALMAGVTAGTRLSAQQAETANSPSAVLVASTIAAPALDSAQQAPAPAQQSSSGNGSASKNQPAQTTQGDSAGQQTKRILGIVPNFRAVSTDEKLPPETVKDKFISATEDSFDYSSIFFPAVIAAYNMDQRSTPQFHQGAAGYARYFWHSAVDQMCIRDRLRASLRRRRAFWANGVAAPAWPSRTANPPGTRPQSTWACLLYTSRCV